MPFLYLVSGTVLSSEFELKTLTSMDGRTPPDIHLKTDERGCSRAPTWFLERAASPGDAPLMSTARVEGGYLLRFHPGADFFIRHDGSEIVAHNVRFANDALEQLLLDQVLPQVLQIRGELSLHASAVVLGHGAVGFTGRSGQGKSTLASAFVPPGMLVSDDCLTLRQSGASVVALPSYRSVRLRDDSATNRAPGVRLTAASSRMTWKRRLELPGVDDAVRMVGVFVLESGPAVSVARLEPGRALAELATQVHRLDPQHRAALVREFEVLTRLVESVPVHVLSYPRDYSALPEVVAAVRSSVGC